jgi:O-antigen/teichoic acid export membrane protein
LSVLKKLAGQTAVYGVSSIIGRSLNYLLTPILTNYFTTGQFGINTEFFSYISFLNVLFTYGMETAYFRFSKTNNEQAVFTTGNSLLLLTSLFFSSILLVCAPFINTALHYQSTPYIIPIMAAILFLDTITTIPFARLRFQNKAARYALLRFISIGVNISATLFFVVLAPWLVKHHFQFINSLYNPEIGIGYVFISTLLASAITALFFIPSILNSLKWPSKELLKQILPYALPLVIVGLAGMVNETLDRILLNYFIPDPAIAKSQIGIYGACYKIAIIITLFIQAFRMAAEPFFYNQSTKENAKTIYAQVMQIFVAACLLIVFGTLLFIDYLQFFIGKDFREGLQVVPILLLGNLCLGIYYNLSVWYRLTDKTVYGSYISIAGAIITIVLNILLIPILGYVGSAWATLICYSAMMVISYFVGQHFYPINYPLGSLGKQFLILIGFYLLANIATKNVLCQVGIFPSLSVVGFLILLALLSVAFYFMYRINKPAFSIQTSDKAP